MADADPLSEPSSPVAGGGGVGGGVDAGAGERVCQGPRRPTRVPCVVTRNRPHSLQGMYGVGLGAQWQPLAAAGTSTACMMAGGPCFTPTFPTPQGLQHR